MFEIGENSLRSLLDTFLKSSKSKEVIQPKPKVIQLGDNDNIYRILCQTIGVFIFGAGISRGDFSYKECFRKL
ncbi:MAG: hypothetical protein ACXVIU_11775 [Halobacteriota archaeon]